MSSVKSLAIAKDLDPTVQEESYVHDVYNEIAPHFSLTRYKPWPVVERFLKSRADHSVGLDVGCGNGKYLNVNPALYMIGTDRSDGLVTCAQGNSSLYNLGVADGLHLPHPENTFDFAISIAVIHHFSTPQRRRDAIAHILSKLKPGAELLVYCWALEQELSRRGYKEGDEQDILVPWVLQKKQEKQKKPRVGKERKGKQPQVVADDLKQNSESRVTLEVELGPTEGVNSDAATTQNTGEASSPTSEVQEALPGPITKYRYYHLYRERELIEDALSTKMCSMVQDGYEKDNWWIIVKRS